jgi:nitroreductase
LGGVYIGGLRNNIESVTELLKLPKHVLPLFGLCLGWPADNPDREAAHACGDAGA